MAKREKPNPFSSQSRPQPRRDLREYEDEYSEPESYDRSNRKDEEYKVFGLGIQNASDRQPTYGYGVAFALIIAAALLLCAIIAIGDGNGDLPPMLQRSTSMLWGVSILALVLSAVGAQYSDSVAQRAMAEDDEVTGNVWLSTAWIIPFVSVFSAVLLIATYHNRWMLALGPLLAFIGMTGALSTRDLMEESDETSLRTAAALSGLVVHFVAFFAFGAIYINKFESRIAVPLVAIITFLLMLDALSRTDLVQPMRVFQSLLGAWILATTMMALNWWPTWGWVGGAVLISVFSMVYCLLMANAEKTPLTRNNMMKYVGFASVLLVILALRSVIL